MGAGPASETPPSQWPLSATEDGGARAAGLALRTWCACMWIDQVRCHVLRISLPGNALNG